MGDTHGAQRGSSSPSEFFERESAGLPETKPTEIVDLNHGDSYDLRIHSVRKQVGEYPLRMLSYNGSIPGPTLRVRQHSQVTVNVLNEAEIETTVHWHGLRLENAFDGVPNYTQAPIQVGGSYRYRLSFPDEGIYWYHPHIREDYAQELGLYGNVLVVPEEAHYWRRADREIVLTLDDILIEDGKIAPFLRQGSDRTAMGRYGNFFLIGGEDFWELDVRRGEIVRFFVTNTANTRTFNIAMPGSVMKLVGGDSGRLEDEELVNQVLISPSERAVVDVLFDTAGIVPLEHCTPERTYRLGAVDVSKGEGTGSLTDFFEPRHFRGLDSERKRLSQELHRPPDKTIALVGRMSMHGHAMPGRPQVAGHHSSESVSSSTNSIEWEDDMAVMNAMTDTSNMQWSITDLETGLSNELIDWSFSLGDRIKVRIVNSIESDHPMHHPIHFHGQRFLVLQRNGVASRNLGWKDSVLVRTGETVEILMDAANPGSWMVHCHIAEHFESGMMFSFRVEAGKA